MLNFAISLVILALCGGADQPAKAADAKAKTEGSSCAMHAKAEGGAAKACCAKHGDKAAKAEGHACNHAEGKTAEKGACCAKHGKAGTAAAHDHAAGASCNHAAKPAAAAKAEAKTEAKTEAKAEPAAKAAAYVCPMHPDVTSDKAGDCSKCGMKLEKKS